MTTLKALINNHFTDKDQIHCYCELYDILFEPVRTTASKIMEIGVDKGGSILLWSQYFTDPNTDIYAIDCSSKYSMDPHILHHVLRDERV